LITYTRRLAAAFAACASFAATTDLHAALVISSNSNVIAGRNAFLAAGTTTTQFDWSSFFAPGAHTTGQLGPVYTTPSAFVTLPDSTVNTIVGTNSNHFPLAIGNWVDAPGFTGLGNTAIADLAINGEESFAIEFGNGHRSVGLAIITGASNLPNEVDLTGATFLFSAKDENGGLLGTALFSLAAGQADQAWLTITSDVSFRRFEVVEIAVVSAYDQYFSNILTSEESVNIDRGTVPEPGSLALLIGAMGGLIAVAKRRRKVQ
jgi:hypothetical protein